MTERSPPTPTVHMDYMLPHHFLLLELSDETGRTLQKDTVLRQYTLNGAVLAELLWQERLIPAKANRFILKPGRPAVTGTLLLAEQRLSESKPRSLRATLQRLSTSLLRRQILQELIDGGALQEEQDRFLLLFTKRRWMPTPDSPEETYIEHLRHHMATVTTGTPPGYDDLMLSLLRSAKLLETVWTPDELETLRPSIHTRTEQVPIGREVHQVVQAVRIALAAAAGS